MMLIPLALANKPLPDIIPDLEDPQLYCKACSRKFADKRRYLNHLRSWHKEVFLPNRLNRIDIT
jgi:hypothetical protein